MTADRPDSCEEVGLVVGSFRGERVGTPFPLLKCLRRHMDGIANHFPAKNALDCRIFHIQSQNVSGGRYPRTTAEASPVLGPRHQFPLGSPAFPLFLFYKRPPAWSWDLRIKAAMRLDCLQVEGTELHQPLDSVTSDVAMLTPSTGTASTSASTVDVSSNRSVMSVVPFGWLCSRQIPVQRTDENVISPNK